MNAHNATVRLLLAICLGVIPQTRGNVVTVRFGATIETSPFTTPGYTPGSGLTGWYSYEQSAAPTDSGANYTIYSVEGMHLTLGGTLYEAASGSLSLVHFLPSITPDATDLFDLSGFSLSGPVVEGFRPAFSELKMIDTDNSVYATLVPPYPIDLPDPAEFETKTLRIGFLQQGSPMIDQEINARIDYIAVPDVACAWCLWSATLGLLALAKMRYGRRCMKGHAAV